MLTRNQQILLLLIFLIAINFIWKINNLEKKNIEKFTITDSDIQEINTAVKRIYLADVEAIRILSNFAIQLSQGGTTVDNNVTFNGAVTTDNIVISNTASNINIASINANNINANNINLTGNLTGNNLTINLTNNNNKVSAITTDTMEVGGNINTNNIVFNDKYKINVPNNIMQIALSNNGNYDLNNGFKFDATTSTLTCNEIIYNKIYGKSNVGAWIINASYSSSSFNTNGSLPIYFSISDYDNYYYNDSQFGYIIMPGYKLELFLDKNYSSNGNSYCTFDNIGKKYPTKLLIPIKYTGTENIVDLDNFSTSETYTTGTGKNQTTHNYKLDKYLYDNRKKPMSCKLYYGDILIPEPSNSIVTIS